MCWYHTYTASYYISIYWNYICVEKCQKFSNTHYQASSLHIFWISKQIKITVEECISTTHAVKTDVWSLACNTDTQTKASKKCEGVSIINRCCEHRCSEESHSCNTDAHKNQQAVWRMSVSHQHTRWNMCGGESLLRNRRTQKPASSVENGCLSSTHEVNTYVCRRVTPTTHT